MTETRNPRFLWLYDRVLAAIVLTGPLVVYGLSVGGMSLRFSRLFIVLALPLVVLRLFSRPDLFARDRFLMFGVLPYLLYTTVSMAWSPNVETGTSVQRLGGLYEVMFVYVALALADLTPARFVGFVKVYVASAVIPLMVSVWQLANNLAHFSDAEVPFERFAITGKYEEVVGGRYFVTAGGFSRISATFAEPVIYGSFLCSVLVLSFVLRPRSARGRWALLLLRTLTFAAMVLTVSKLAILSLAIALLVIGRKDRRFLGGFVIVTLAFGSIVGVMSVFGLLEVFDRLLSESGHYELLLETFEFLRRGSLVLGEGIGSIPYGSFHRFALSRLYESGLVGVIFVGFVTANPLKLLVRPVRDAEVERINLVVSGVLCATVFGLHSYDYFIHLWPWIVTGAVMSFYNGTTVPARARRQSAFVSLSPVPSRLGP